MKILSPDQVAQKSLRRYWVLSAFWNHALASLSILVPPIIRISNNEFRYDGVMLEPKKDRFSSIFFNYIPIAIAMFLVGVFVVIFSAIIQIYFPVLIFLSYVFFYFLYETILWRFQPLEPEQISSVAHFLMANKEEYWKENLAKWIAIRPLTQRDRLVLTKAWNKKEKILEKQRKEIRYIEQTNKLLGGEIGALVEKYRLKNETVPAPIKEAMPRRL